MCVINGRISSGCEEIIFTSSLFIRHDYESEFTRNCSYKHLGLQIDCECFNRVLSKLWSHLWSDQHFPMQLPVFHSLLGSLRGIWCKIIYIVALVSPIWDIFLAQSGWEGVVLGLTMSSGSISQLGRWCQLGIRNSESTNVGDGFHKRKKLYVTGYHTCIYV